MENMVNDNILKISGSIGMVKLIKNDKNIFIFYDDHSNTSYCKESESIFLYEMFDKIINSKKDYVILLEEPFINNYSNIKFLWNETPHIMKFRNFYKKIISNCKEKKKCKIFPVDLRLLICDISIDDLISNLNSDEYFLDYKVLTWEYFKQLLYLFDYMDYDEIFFSNSDSNIKFVKKVFDKFKDDKYYIKLKIEFDKFFNKFIKPNEMTPIRDFLKKNRESIHGLFTGFPFENNHEEIFLDQYDKLINGIMELYAYILLTNMNNKNIIIYCGYYHSNNLAYILKKYYNYKEIINIGNTIDIEKKEDKYIDNCLIINKNIF